MATITLDTDKLAEDGIELGKDETVHFSFANSAFDLSAGQEFDTDSLESEESQKDAISNATENPWLNVVLPEPPVESPQPDVPVQQQQAPTPQTVAETNTADKETQ